MISLSVATALAALAAGLSVELDPSTRPILAGAGAIFVVGSVLWATRRATAHEAPGITEAR